MNPLLKWHRFWSTWTAQATEILVRAVPSRAGLSVLDLASGSGEPALSIAGTLGGGHVTATDVGQEIIEVAREIAQEQGLVNMAFDAVDAQHLPYPDGSFDAVTCRFGVMFLPDARGSLREASRVLKPGGHALHLVWGPGEQPYFAGTAELVRKYADLPPEGPDELQPFRFAEPGKLARLMRDAGFASVAEIRHDIHLVWTGRPETPWEYFSESSASYRPIIEGLSPERRQQLSRESHAAMRRFYDGETLRMPATVLLVSGTRR